MADTQTSRSIRTLADLPALYAQMTETPEFQRAFGDPIPLSIIEPGDAPGEHDMPEPLAVQAECGAIVATIFDLFADTRLAPLAAEVAWGIVNSFHFTAQKLERREQALADELGDLARRPDLSEVYNNELEEKQLLCQSVAEHREARVQAYEGVCIARAGAGIQENFTVRKISYGEGVERVFPIYSPMLESVEVVRRGRVRRAKLYYLRDRRGKSARIVENTNARSRKLNESAKQAAANDKAAKAPKAAE